MVIQARQAAEKAIDRDTHMSRSVQSILCFPRAPAPEIDAPAAPDFPDFANLAELTNRAGFAEDGFLLGPACEITF